jgi:small subunit ribosomal protein S8
MVNDPISDFIIRLKNAQMANKETVVIDYSKLKEAIGTLLADSGYIKSVSKKKKNNTLEVELNSKKSDKFITGVMRVSKPSRRIYEKAGNIYPFRRGFGMAVISTSKGLKTDKQAIKEKVGGEVLFKIW